MKLRIAVLGFGLAFGFLLSWAQLTDPMVIQRMLLLQEPDVFLLMGSAMAVAFVGVRLLRGAGATSLVGAEPIRWETTRPTRDHVVGSLIFGLGWSVASTCPGPLAAQLGQGMFASLFTIAGVVVGIAIRGAQLSNKPTLTSVSSTPIAGM